MFRKLLDGEGSEEKEDGEEKSRSRDIGPEQERVWFPQDCPWATRGFLTPHHSRLKKVPNLPLHQARGRVCPVHGGPPNPQGRQGRAEPDRRIEIS